MKNWIAGALIAACLALSVNAQTVTQVVNAIVATTCAANNWVNVVAATGAATCAQPATTNLSDTTAPTTWTPVLAFGGASVGITYSAQTGRYTKIGSLYIATFRITLSSKGSSVGAATVTGWPVGTTGSWSGSCSFYATFNATVTSLGGYLAGTTWTVTQNGAGGISGPTDTVFNNTSDMICTVVYGS